MEPSIARGYLHYYLMKNISFCNVDQKDEVGTTKYWCQCQEPGMNGILESSYIDTYHTLIMHTTLLQY
jgi:hypothetical protein